MKTGRFLYAAAAAALTLSMMCSCGDTSSDPAADTAPAENASSASSEAASESETSAEISSSETVSAETDDDNNNLSASDEELSRMNALEISKLMGNGIDLGNTHEAYGHGSHPADTDPKVFEGLWGQPATTREIIDGMKASGFDSVRIPIAWTNAMDYESGDYTISPAFMDRIEEVVGYALDADMFVVINDHWDGSWWGMFGSETPETREKAMDMYISMWTQIAERFKDHSYKLIFESANEELGDRLNDKDVAKDSGSLSEAECYTTANLINQKFVDTVRASGGKNADRFLLIAGYNTDIEKTCKSSYQMPSDTADGKLLVSVHYYTPSDYCIFGSAAHWGTAKQYEEQNRLLEMMTKFTDQGYGVIIGEYGVLTESTKPREDSDLWFSNFLNNCDKYNYVPMLWDCNNLYNKTTCTIPDKETAELFSSRSNSARADMTDEQIVSTAADEMEAALKAAEERVFETGNVPAADENTAVAWIMYQSGDYSISYSVGDTYDPVSASAGIIAENVVITGAGEYTVSLDLSEAGRAKGAAFSALGIANGEQLFPNSVIDIKSIKINGEEYEFADGHEYTSSDDGKCTRVNLHNQWVSKVPETARTPEGNTELSASVLEIPDAKIVKSISVTFDLITE